uniref:Uncharacterized protein n=1 Tax=Anguilla anguilla TaxID=7936 RepID=A0A0E9SDB0_ANGAN
MHTRMGALIEACLFIAWRSTRSILSTVKHTYSL